MEFLSKEGLTYFWSKLKTRFDSLTSATNTNTSEIAVQKARIDSITSLPAGSTSGDAELIDIRVKANGTTATSAGNAVREQVEELSDIFCDLIEHSGSRTEVTIDLLKYDPINSALSVDGKLVAASSRITTKGFIDVSEFAYLKLTRTNGFGWNIAFYSAPSEDAFTGATWTGWVNYDQSLERKGDYMRITAYNPSSSIISPSEFAGIHIVGVNYRLESKNLNEMIKANREKDVIVLPLRDTFTQGNLTEAAGAINPAASTFSASEDFIDVRDYDKVELYCSTSYKIYVTLYDENKAYIANCSTRTTFPYSADISGASYIKVCAGALASTLFTPGGIENLYAVISRVSDTSKRGNYTMPINVLFKLGSLAKGIYSKNASSRITTKQFTKIENVNVLSVKPLNGYYCAVAFYSAANEASFLTQWGWFNTEQTFDVSDCSYYRLTMRRSDNAGMDVSEGFNVEVNAYFIAESYELGFAPAVTSKLEYTGEKISINPTCNYYNILEKLTNIVDTSFPFATYYQQGGTIYNDYAFLFRHHSKCSVLDLRDFSLVSEFTISDISETSHCNSANFSKAYPVGNTAFPYLYVGRCSYTSNSQEGETVADLEECYVLNITTSSATLAQIIKYTNDNGDYSYSSWDWMVDNDRNRLVCIGYAEAYGAARRSYIFKEFNLPDPTSGGVITLHDTDVIEQWRVEDETLQAFQGGTIYGKYVFVPASNETTESVFVYDKYAHRKIANIPLVKAVTQELQSASFYNGKLYIIAAEGRIDEIIFN